MSAQRTSDTSAERLRAIRNIRSMDAGSMLRRSMTGFTCVPKSALCEPHYQAPTRIDGAAIGILNLDGAVDGAAVSIEAGCAVNYPASSQSSVSSTRTPAKLQRRRSRSQRSVPPSLPKRTGFWVGYRYDRAKELKAQQTKTDGDVRHKQDGGTPNQASSSSSVIAEPFPPFELVPEDPILVKGGPEQGESAAPQSPNSRPDRASSNVEIRRSLLQPVTEEPIGYESDTAAHRHSLTTHAGDFAGYDSDSAVRPDAAPSRPFNDSPDYDSDSTIRQTTFRRQSTHQSHPSGAGKNETQEKHIKFSKDLPHAEHVCPVSEHGLNQSHHNPYQRPLQTCDNSNLSGSVATTLSSSSLYTAPPPHPDCMCKDIEGDIHHYDRSKDVHKDIYDYPHRNGQTRQSQFPVPSGRGRASTDATATTARYQEWVSDIEIPSALDLSRQESAFAKESSNNAANANAMSTRSTYQSGSQSSARQPEDNEALDKMTTIEDRDSDGTDVRDELSHPPSGADKERFLQKQDPSALQPRVRKEYPVELIFSTSNQPPQLPTIAPFTPLIPERPLRYVTPRDRSQSHPQPKTQSQNSDRNCKLDNQQDTPDLRPAPLRISPRRSGATGRDNSDTREVGTQTSRPTLKMSESFVRQELNAELGALPAATYPWLSLSLVRQVRQAFRTEFASFQKQVDERLAAIEERVKSQQEWLEGFTAECEGVKEGRGDVDAEIPGRWEDDEKI